MKATEKSSPALKKVARSPIAGSNADSAEFTILLDYDPAAESGKVFATEHLS